ncbi:sigma-54-dependent Fis family transcriptional regulator [Marinobacterium sp. xm-a-152]|uniref:sigma-54 interaction domain-containing protein n=1 Tax=Marinobacterium sp. xm-a-152 TaxID=2497733 RepID=UPI001568F77B|nr:sigma-54 dependent transcriptional regulator [Marinobacterium sp. xm-a-152]NRP14426.1 Nitrogen assimilation regulatory protein [Marinobacterium sp. xm-a-152]
MAKTSLKNILVGSSAAMQELRQQIEQVAHTSATVLVLGESGTGKELVARGIHELSNRSKQNLVPLNCGAIPKDLFESELFGHEKGAFSGAVASRVGRFELADNGTLFLDEIGEMPLDMQVKMLRALQERVIERVGSGKSIEVDTRIVAATNRCLETSIAKGEFREDLYYRLNVFPIFVPPLREREGDVVELFDHLAKRFAMKDESPIRLTGYARVEIMKRQWLGNVRELSNFVERLSIRYPGQEITLEMLPAAGWRETLLAESSSQDHLVNAQQISAQPASGQNISGEYAFKSATHSEAPTHFSGTQANSSATTAAEHAALMGHELPSNRSPASPPDLPTVNVSQGIVLKEHLQKIEVDCIEQALKCKKGNVASAARLLGLRRTTLIEKIKKYGVAVPA